LEKNVRCYDNCGVYEEDKKLTMLYELLTELGYIMSTDEIAMINGTHDLYKILKKCRECGKDEYNVYSWYEDDLCEDCAQSEAAA